MILKNFINMINSDSNRLCLIEIQEDLGENYFYNFLGSFFLKDKEKRFFNNDFFKTYFNRTIQEIYIDNEDSRITAINILLKIV